jgi:thiol-disulfide isomerase/thioredoxin
LEGKVVLIDFWTYSCINCIRTYPYLKAWWGKYQDEDFIMIGVHTPEFPFEKNLANVEKAAKDSELTFPIALDNDYVTWRNFHNRFWPAKYLFDKDGQLRYTHFGEGKYEETEAVIQQLLGVEEELADGPEVDFSKIKSPETYLGWARMERFASPEQLVRNQVNTFTTPETLALNNWGLSGDWLVEEEYSESRSQGSVFFQYNSAAVNIVAESEEEASLEIRIDGNPVPADLRGKDITEEPDGTTRVRIQDATLYELIHGDGEAHLIEIISPEEGVKIYTFTFG